MVEEISQQQILGALEHLDQLCKDEYGNDHDLLTLLQNPDTDMSARRLQRLIGVLVKEPFAEWRPIGTDLLQRDQSEPGIGVNPNLTARTRNRWSSNC